MVLATLTGLQSSGGSVIPSIGKDLHAVHLCCCTDGIDVFAIDVFAIPLTLCFARPVRAADGTLPHTPVRAATLPLTA